jgi:hypothetical protein
MHGLGLDFRCFACRQPRLRPLIRELVARKRSNAYLGTVCVACFDCWCGDSTS